TDKAIITRKWSKSDKYGHGNGRARKKPENAITGQQKSNLGQPQSTHGQLSQPT
ncbi:hypothetical protein Tco_0110351, partial [Tanacetum coccineum]